MNEPTKTELYLLFRDYADNCTVTGYGNMYYLSKCCVYKFVVKGEEDDRQPTWEYLYDRVDLEEAAHAEPDRSFRDEILRCLNAQDPSGIGSTNISWLYTWLARERHHQACCLYGTDVRPIDSPGGEDFETCRRALAKRFNSKNRSMTHPKTYLCLELALMLMDGLVEECGPNDFKAVAPGA